MYFRLSLAVPAATSIGTPDAIQPEYALVARFSSVANESIKHRSSYYLCVYELTNIENRQVLWNGRYEVKKTAVKGFLD